MADGGGGDDSPVAPPGFPGPVWTVRVPDSGPPYSAAVKGPDLDAVTHAEFKVRCYRVVGAISSKEFVVVRSVSLYSNALSGIVSPSYRPKLVSLSSLMLRTGSRRWWRGRQRTESSATGQWCFWSTPATAVKPRRGLVGALRQDHSGQEDCQGHEQENSRGHNGPGPPSAGPPRRALWV